MQQIAGDIIILLMRTKNHNHDVLFLRHLDRMFCHFGPFFAHSPP